MPHELLRTTWEKIKIRNAFANNILIDIKLSKGQLPKIVQSFEFLGALLGKFAGPLMILSKLLES